MKQKHHLTHRLHPDTLLIAALVLFVCVLTGVVFSYWASVVSQDENTLGVCLRETYTCPNGTIVSRSGPECQFSACPSNVLPNHPGITEEPFEVPPTTTLVPAKKTAPVTKNEIVCTQEVKLCSDGSFVGRSGPRCEFAPCPDNAQPES